MGAQLVFMISPDRICNPELLAASPYHRPTWIIGEHAYRVDGTKVKLASNHEAITGTPNIKPSAEEKKSGIAGWDSQVAEAPSEKLHSLINSINRKKKPDNFDKLRRTMATDELVRRGELSPETRFSVGPEDRRPQDLSRHPSHFVRKWTEDLEAVEHDPRFFDETNFGHDSRKRADKLRSKLSKVLKENIVPRYGQDAPGQPDHVRPQFRYVQAPDGTADFGRITPEMAQASGLRELPIRLQHGNAYFGELHMDVKHGQEFRRAGFNSVRGFVAHVTSSIDRIVRRPDGGIALVKNEGRRGALYVDLHPTFEYYTVATGYLAGKAKIRGEVLWDRRLARSRDSESTGLTSILGEPEVSQQRSGVPYKGSEAKVQSPEDSIPSSPLSVKQNPTDPNTRFSIAPAESAGIPAPQARAAAKPGIADRVRDVLDSEPVQAARRKLEDEFLPVRRAVAAIKKAGGIVDDANNTDAKLDTML